MLLLVLAACHPQEPDPVCTEAVERARVIERRIQANEEQLLQIESMARDIARRLPEIGSAEARCPPPVSCELDPQFQYYRDTLNYVRTKIDKFKENWDHGKYETYDEIKDALDEL